MESKLLIVEDQFIEANNLRKIMKRAGYIVCTISRSVEEALLVIEREKPDMVLLDIFLDGAQTGIDLARILNKKDIPFVYLSANSNRQTLNAAKTTEPQGFLVKPFREKDVLVMLDVALFRHKRKEDNLKESSKQTTSSLPERSFHGVIAKSKSMKDILEQVQLVGRSDTSVLVLGESGTGKELIAKAIHQVSGRNDKPLIVVNCAALPANLIESELFGHERGAFTGAIEKRTGKFEQASGGTIFLDEIGDLPLDLQVKFLRVLQEREIDPIGGKSRKINVRVIAATNRDLVEEMAAGKFRMDLYYRLNVFPIILPPLRERKEDILALAEHFIQHFAAHEQKSITGFSDDVIKSLLSYGWPGNIRELENIMERAVLLSNSRLITKITLPPSFSKHMPIHIGSQLKTMTENQRDHILAALEQCDWKIFGKGGAAEMLDMNGNTLQSKMKKLGIEKHIGPK
jgi:two-component system response regulator HydG